MEYPLRILADLEEDLRENERDICRAIEKLNELQRERIMLIDAIDEIKRMGIEFGVRHERKEVEQPSDS